MAEAIRATGAASKREAVEIALRQVTRAARQLKAIEGLRGIGWEGDLDDMRTSKYIPEAG